MIITGYFGEHYDRVDVDGRPLDPMPSQAVYNHSQDGFAWGYAGSGPAQLALAILLAEPSVSPQAALVLHQQFKREFVAGLPDRADFTLQLDVRRWAAQALGAAHIAQLPRTGIR